jgi:hypothetical protein
MNLALPVALHRLKWPVARLRSKELLMNRVVPTVFTTLVAMFFASSATARVEPGVIRHFGMCDASASVALGSTMFVVANDEDDVLRVYLRDQPGKPVHTFDLALFLKSDPDYPEADIEGAARIGDRIYWISSHATNKDGMPRPSRHRLFATEVKVAADKVSITPAGTPYINLVKDLSETPWLKAFKLGEAAKRQPEGVGGLNIEGLAATPQGKLLIAFRNPISDGKALLVPLENPREVVSGKAAKLGKPILLFLDGRGIRDIAYFDAWGSYLIIAGPYGDSGDFKLYRWSGAAAANPEPVKGLDFKDLRPEALTVYPGEKTKIQILSDDGAEQVDGKDCKDKKVNPEKKSFRSVWVTL